MLKRVLKRHLEQHSDQGFTLIELLISMIMAGIIISGLLFLVVDLLRTDQRELTLERTQQEMKRALDYIADDVREAIYVYSNPTPLIDELKSTEFALPNDARPVLAFWKIKQLDVDAGDYSKLSTPGTASCNGLTGDPLNKCRVLLVRHGYYELVIYYSTEDNPDNLWEGVARVYRYSVPEYSRAALTQAATVLQENSIYVPNNSVDPEEGGPPGPGWVPNDSGTGVLRGDVLVDFVAKLDDLPAVLPPCESNYSRVPALTTGTTASNSFYACIRPSNSSNNLLNQDVSIYLRGDADPTPTNSSLVLGGVSDSSELPTLQTRVLTRGVVNKNLPD